jgi:hypothetical protein|tara:strand:+ start:172 stop:450 length:279 start_codon:yes stop_codon:yes gene_type:complete
MPRFHNVNNEKIPFSVEEEAARDAEEQAWTAGANDRAVAALREKRNQLLIETDWWVLRGSPTDAQNAYRLALRDLPANTADPSNPTWPEEPS